MSRPPLVRLLLKNIPYECRDDLRPKKTALTSSLPLRAGHDVLCKLSYRISDVPNLSAKYTSKIVTLRAIKSLLHVYMLPFTASTNTVDENTSVPYSGASSCDWNCAMASSMPIGRGGSCVTHMIARPPN